MRRLQLISFATPNFGVSKAILVKSAKCFGIADVKVFTGISFSKTNFFQQHSKIAVSTKGAGYWLWKPYYILECLQALDEGDVLIYCDSGVKLDAPLTPLINLVSNNRSGILLFENYQGSCFFNRTSGMIVNEYNLYVEMNKNRHWIKRDAFVLMNLDRDRFWNSPQVGAYMHLYRKSSTSVEFVKDWLSYCCDEQILTDLPNQCGLPDFDNLVTHIHDQAILSLLAEREKIKLYRCPSQFGNHYKVETHRIANEFLLLPYVQHPKTDSEYGTLITHHRTKNMPFFFRIKSFAKQEINIFLSQFDRGIP